MNSRQRIRSALRFQEADRVPIDNNAYLSGMHEVAYKNLLKYLNIDGDIEIFDYVQRLSLVKREILDKLGVDIINIYPKSPSNHIFEGDPDNKFEDEFGVVYKRTGHYGECYIPPLQGKSFDEVKKYKFPDPTDTSRFKSLGKLAKNYLENTEYSIWGGAVPSLFYTNWTLRGFAGSMEDIYLNPEIAIYLTDKIMDYWMQYMGGFLDEVGPYIDVFWGGGDDWGHQEGPIIDPVYFRREMVPRYKKMISFFKSKTDAKCCYHCCGAVGWCMDDLIDMGVDILHPLQANASGNDTGRIKEKYGKKMIFHGGTNNQGVFHKDIHIMTIDTLGRIKDLAPGGGHIFSSGHNIQPNMPPENILRLFELAREFGKYPLDLDAIDRQIEKEKKILKNKP